MTEIRTDDRGDVEEVAVLDAASVHVERLSAGAFRVVVARAGGKLTVLNVGRYKGRLYAAVVENDP